jgi:hypothetical protein
MSPLLAIQPDFVLRLLRSTAGFERVFRRSQVEDFALLA